MVLSSFSASFFFLFSRRGVISYGNLFLGYLREGWEKEGMVRSQRSYVEYRKNSKYLRKFENSHSRLVPRW